MKRRIRPLSVMALCVAGVLAVTPVSVYAQQAPGAPGADHSAHQPASPPASGTGIEDLLTKMYASTGDAKIAVMADLIEQLIKDRHACASMMPDRKMMPAPAPAADPPPR